MTDRTAASVICPSCGAHSTGNCCDRCGASLKPAACDNCSAPLVPGARFCNRCGAPVSSSPPLAEMARLPSPDTNTGIASYAPWGVAVLILVSVVGYFAGRTYGAASPNALSSDAPVAPVATGAAGGAVSGRAPDITNLTPRERASRLFDRIMRYAEEGKQDSVQFFAPMAMASFEMLGADIDVDARYDYGRVASETGHLDVAAAQADTILRQAPTHLLGLALRARTATSLGDKTKAAATWNTFLGARDAELRKGLPEYQMHASDIQQATRLATVAK